MDQNPTCSRKSVEKKRRNEMKALYSKLSSLLPHHPALEKRFSVPDQLEVATNYIKMMQAHLEKMKHKKNFLTNNRLPKPNIDVRITGSAMEVVLTTGPNSHSLFTGIIRLLHEQGVEVVAASFAVLDNTVFHTIHSKIGGSSGAARVSERLRKFVNDLECSC